MTAGSIQRVLNTMQQLHEHAAPGVLPERKSGGGWELTATSSFVDIGSGYGKVRVASIPSRCLAAAPPPMLPSETAASREASIPANTWDLHRCCWFPVAAKRCSRRELNSSYFCCGSQAVATAIHH